MTAKNVSAVAVAKMSITAKRNTECIDVRLKLIMGGLVIAFGGWGLCLEKLPNKNRVPIAIASSPNVREAFLEAKDQSEINNRKSKNVLAERVGFEPTERFPAHSISSAANSTTLAPLHEGMRAEG